MKVLLVAQSTVKCTSVSGNPCGFETGDDCDECERIYEGEQEGVEFDVASSGFKILDSHEVHYVDTKYDLFRVWHVEVSGRGRKKSAWKFKPYEGSFDESGEDR